MDNFFLLYPKWLSYSGVCKGRKANSSTEPEYLLSLRERISLVPAGGLKKKKKWRCRDRRNVTWMFKLFPCHLSRCSLLVRCRAKHGKNETNFHKLPLSDRPLRRVFLRCRPPWCGRPRRLHHWDRLARRLLGLSCPFWATNLVPQPGVLDFVAHRKRRGADRGADSTLRLLASNRWPPFAGWGS